MGCGRRRLVSAGATLAIAGCTIGGADAPGFVVRDSAGVAIVESHAPAWPEGEGWRVADEPALHLGVVDGPEEVQFGNIAGVVRMPDGRIVVGDRRAPGGALRIFGPDGAFLGDFGPEGEGPGEIALLISLFRYRGDSLAVWDGRLNRLSVFDDRGRVGRTVRIDIPMEMHEGPGEFMLSSPGAVRGAFADGSLYVRGGAWFHPARGVTYRMELDQVRYSPDGEPLEVLGTFTIGEDHFPRDGPAVTPWVPYLRQFPLAHGASTLYVGTGDTYEIHVVGAGGTLERIVRASHRDLTLTGEAREAYFEAQRARTTDPDERRDLERLLSAVQFPQTLPPYDRFQVDAREHLWVRDAALPGRVAPHTWSVFDPEGRLLGTVVTPAGLAIHEIGADFALGVWTDELDVPFVRVYTLERE